MDLVRTALQNMKNEKTVTPYTDGTPVLPDWRPLAEFGLLKDSQFGHLGMYEDGPLRQVLRRILIADGGLQYNIRTRLFNDCRNIDKTHCIADCMRDIRWYDFEETAQQACYIESVSRCLFEKFFYLCEKREPLPIYSDRFISKNDMSDDNIEKEMENYPSLFALLYDKIHAYDMLGMVCKQEPTNEINKTSESTLPHDLYSNLYERKEDYETKMKEYSKEKITSMLDYKHSGDRGLDMSENFSDTETLDTSEE